MPICHGENINKKIAIADGGTQTGTAADKTDGQMRFESTAKVASPVFFAQDSAAVLVALEL